MSIRTIWFCCSLLLLPGISFAQAPDAATNSSQYITVLGIAQDGGYPQAGCNQEHCLRHWRGEEDKRQVVSLGLTNRPVDKTGCLKLLRTLPRNSSNSTKLRGLPTSRVFF